jgi:hypothetical protein
VVGVCLEKLFEASAAKALSWLVPRCPTSGDTAPVPLDRVDILRQVWTRTPMLRRRGTQELAVDRHDGRTERRADAGGPRVRWTSTIHVHLLLIGRPIERAVAGRSGNALRSAPGKASSAG